MTPRKYHAYISPLRRVFLDAREDDSRAVVGNLNEEIAAFKERVALLEFANATTIFSRIAATRHIARWRASE
jgi:hypothetical protein